MMTRKNKAFLSRTTGIIILSSLLYRQLSLNNTLMLHRTLPGDDDHNVPIIQRNLHQEHGCLLPPPPPSVLPYLLNLFETLPDGNTTILPPPFREVSYIFPRQKEVPTFHITLTTQLTVSKLPRLLQLLERWRGPISCAVHLPDPSDIHTLCDFVQHQNEENNMFKNLVTMHVMLEKPSPEFGYPVNRLRNLSLKNIDTQYFFIADVDFIPREAAHENLLELLAKNSNSGEKVKKLFVLPAFEVFGEGSDRNNATVTSLEDIPEDKAKLLAMLPTKKLQPFHMEYHPSGHAATNYEKWYACPKGGSYPTSYAWMFEPYIVGNRYGIPRFNEKLRGYGLNKAAWVAEAYLQGYEFEVLCDHFVVHMNHPGRRGRRLGNSEPAIRWYQNTFLPGRYNMTIAEFRKVSRRARRDRQLALQALVIGD